MNDDDPVAVRVRRGGDVESLHRAAWVLTDTSGAVLDGRGDPDQWIFGPSSVKSLQSLALVHSGAFDRFGFGDAELAVTAASHAGLARHVEVVASMLERIGLDASVLRCGPREPGHELGPVAHECSGKHAGFLATAVHLGQDPVTYLDPAGPAQRSVRGSVVAMTGAELDDDLRLDGCSAPTFRLPLRSLATGVARLVSPGGPEHERGAGCARVVAAVAAEPEMIAGPGRFDTVLSQATAGRLFPKTGAEGVFVLGDTTTGRSLATKIDDGSVRATPPLVLALARAVGMLDDAELDALGIWADRSLHNAAGLTVGELEVADGIVPSRPVTNRR